jgi:hypothetical protein
VAIACVGRAAAADPSAPMPSRVIVGAGLGLTPWLPTADAPLYGSVREVYVDALVRPVARAKVLALASYSHGAWLAQLQDNPFYPYERYGTWWQLRGGAELHDCLDRNRHACGFVDAAIGVLQFVPSSDASHSTGTLSARVGIDVGIRRIRFRVAADLVVALGKLEIATSCGKLELGAPSGPKLGVAFAF